MKMHMPILSVVEKAAQEGLRETVNEVKKTAQSLAPIDDETLVKSARASVDDLEGSVRFTAPHAWLQHERTEYKHPRGGQAKYLETAVEQVSALAFMASAASARIRG